MIPWGAYTMQTSFHSVDNARARREPSMFGVLSKWKCYVWHKNLNVDYSDTMASTVITLGTMILCDKIFQAVTIWVTFSQGHAHLDRQTILKSENMTLSHTFWTLQSWSFAQIYFVARPSRTSQFLRPSSKFRVIRASGQILKISNMSISSDTVIVTDMKAGTVVVYVKAFHGIPVKLTFLQGQRRWWKL